jgi:PGF-pre-PGF domain-containing protein
MTGGGWCEEIGCWEFWGNASQCINANATYGLNCAWETMGHCEELGCWNYNTNASCLNTSDNLDCNWQTGPGFCEGPGQCWDKYDNTSCTNAGCTWKTGWCEDLGCWNFWDNATCTNTTLHPNINCTWKQDQWGGGWCEEQGCWNYMNQSACVNNTDNLICLWNDIYNYCYEPKCWDYGDQSTCQSQGCTWNTDSWGHGWCEEPGCWSYWNNQTACQQDTTCLWKEETACEEARCWLWDGNESACVNNTYGLNCTWDNSTSMCNEYYAAGGVCSQYDGNEKGCMDTGYCWWDGMYCNNPDADWMAEMAEDIINPGCWMFDYNFGKCQNVTGCTWENSTEECNGLEEAGVQCSYIKDRELCEGIPVLDTCCVWRSGKCEADKASTRCYENFQPPPAGAAFCEDENAYTSEDTCKRIMGEPWYMPCKWEDYDTADTSDDRCVFRAAEKFGGMAGGCDMITNKKDCEFAGCEWKQEFYCEGNKSVPFGWCEEKTGAGSKSCDAACWACDTKAKCDASKLSCEWDNDKGSCEISADILYGGGDCQTDCTACENKDSPRSACEQSGAGCKWVQDTTGVTTIGGWCYPQSEKSCAEDCFKCYDQTSCVNYGKGSKDSCVWDSTTKICMPKNYDKEICFDGQDNDNDGKIDCEDGDCFSDPFCGAGFISECWKYDDQGTCVSQGAAEGCIWISDPWTGEEWCGMKGENCFLWDGDEAGCNGQTGVCEWFTDPKGGFCDLNTTKTKACSKLTSQGACAGNPDCTWTAVQGSTYGGVCEPKVLTCEDKGQTACIADARCAWIVDPFTGEQECEPICFSNNLGSNSTCTANDNCQWISGICDPASDLGMKMEDCWQYDDDPTACQDAPACDWHQEMTGGFCDLNKTLFETCMVIGDQTTCDAATECKWNGDPLNGWCDPAIFSCGWYTDETSCTTDAMGYGVSCAWINDSMAMGPGPGGPSGPRCEPVCFGLQDPGACTAAPVCEFRSGFCEPKMAKMMFEGMDSPPVILGGDPCPEGTIGNESDICGFGVKEMPDNFGFGINVVSLENAAVCKGKKVVSGPPAFVELTSSGVGTNTTKFFIYLDTDGNSTNGCPLMHNSSSSGYEFFMKYVAKWVDGDLKETRKAMRCEAGNWTIADIKLTGWSTLMCSEIGGGMLAVDKGDLKKFPGLFLPGADMRVYVATAGNENNENNPIDTAGPVYYSQGRADFKFEDCSLSGVDMDGDGLKSENDPDCFIFHEQGFVKFEDCFPGTGDEDGDGLINCDDPDCKFAPNCAGIGVNAPDYVDNTPPSLVWHEVDRFPDAAFIKYDTDEPANGTLTFYYNDSSCSDLNTSGMARVVYDVGIIDSFVPEFKNWHDAPVDNFDFNPQGLGYDLSNGTTYYYKITICDPDDNCAESACLSFNTTRSSSKRDCPDCEFLFKFEGAANMFIDFGGDGNWDWETGSQGGMCTNGGGVKANYSQGMKVNIRVDGSNGSITFGNATLTGLSESINLTEGLTTTGDGKEVGYVGMNSSSYDELASKIRPKTCVIRVPRGSEGYCTELWHCEDPVNGTLNESTCVDVSSNATLINQTTDYCEWEVACDFSVYMAGDTPPSTNPPTSSSSGGGGGGAVKGVIIKLINAGGIGEAIFDLIDTGYISKITVASKETVYNVRIVAEALEKKPYPSMADPVGKVLSYLKLTKSGISNTQFEKAEVDFQVPVSWLKENDISQSEVYLQRDATNKWETVETTYISEDADYAYFKAVTPTFSYFVITGMDGSGYTEPSIPPETEAPPVTTAPPMETPAVTKAPVVTPAPEKKAPVPAVAAGEPEKKRGICGPSILLVIAAISGVIMGRKRWV